MHIEAYQKLTLLDFPGLTAATIFTHGCNFRCPFCHNAGLVVRKSESQIPESEILEYLEKMTDAVEEATYISMSKNSAIDAVINEKMLLAQKNGIATHFQVDSLEKINVPSMDICTILSNALDNAIEANVKVEKMSDRYIETKITKIVTRFCTGFWRFRRSQRSPFGYLFLTIRSASELLGSQEEGPLPCREPR